MALEGSCELSSSSSSRHRYTKSLFHGVHALVVDILWPYVAFYVGTLWPKYLIYIYIYTRILGPSGSHNFLSCFMLIVADRLS